MNFEQSPQITIKNHCIIAINDFKTNLGPNEISKENEVELRDQLNYLLTVKATSFTGIQDKCEYILLSLLNKDSLKSAPHFTDGQTVIGFRFETDIEKIEGIVDNLAAHGVTFSLLFYIPNKEFTKAIKSWKIDNLRIGARIYDTCTRDLSEDKVFGMNIILKHKTDCFGKNALVIDRDLKWANQHLELLNGMSRSISDNLTPK